MQTIKQMLIAVCIVQNHEHHNYIYNFIYVAPLSSNNGFSLRVCFSISSIRLSRWQGWFPCRWRNPRAATTDHKGCIIFHRRFEYITNTFLTLVGEHIPSGDYGSILRADVGCEGCHSLFCVAWEGEMREKNECFTRIESVTSMPTSEYYPSNACSVKPKQKPFVSLCYSPIGTLRLPCRPHLRVCQLFTIPQVHLSNMYIIDMH